MANSSVLSEMSTQELDKILRDELQNPSADGDLVREILRILEDREADCPVEVMPTMEAAWKKYTWEDQGRGVRRKPVARSWIIRAVPIAVAICLVQLIILQF